MKKCKNLLICYEFQSLSVRKYLQRFSEDEMRLRNLIEHLNVSPDE